MKNVAFSFVALGLLSACATSQGWSVDQSRQAEDVILIAYATDNLQDSPISGSKANNVALRHCEMRGYGHTEKQVHVTQQCTDSSAAGTCSAWKVQRAYQCGGNAIAPTAMSLEAPVPNFAAASRP